MSSPCLQELLFSREKPIKVQYLQTARLRIKRNNNMIKTVLFRVTTALSPAEQTAHCFRWDTLSNCISAVHLINLTNEKKKKALSVQFSLREFCILCAREEFASFLMPCRKSLKKLTSMRCFESESWARHERVPALDGLCAQGKKIHSWIQVRNGGQGEQCGFVPRPVRDLPSDST